MRSEQPTPPPPWERKERKFERGGSGSGSGSGSGAVSGDAPPGVSASASATTSRWRDLRYGGPVARDSPRRPPSGHHRLYSEESSSRSDRLYAEDERRHGRDNHNSCRRSPTLSSPSNFPRRPSYDTSIVTAARSLTIPVSTASTKQPSSKDHTDSRDHSLVPLSWKPLKWARPSSSSFPSKDEMTLKVLVPSVNEAPVASPVKSPSVGDEMGSSRKKARLGWGQGLAKYEKEKVQVSVDSSGGPGDASSSGAVDVCVSGAADAGISGPVKAASCPSPVTPLSVTSRPPAIPAQTQCTATESTDGNNSHQNVAEPDTQPCSKDLPVKLDFSVNSVSSLSTLLANLLQPEEACMGDSMFMNKVSMVKIDILKELEKTECEIDSLELELKSLNFDKPVGAQQDQVMLPIEKISETFLEATTECHKLITEEPVRSEKQESMLVDLKIEDYEGQAISRCSDEPSSSKDSDNTLALSELTDKGTNLICSILASNKDAAKLASKSIGIAEGEVDVGESVKVSCSKIDNLRIKEKLAVRKRQMKFKDQVLALKFMALRQLWKEDMRLLNIKNNFTKSGKRVSLSSVPPQCTSQKQRSSVRSRLASSDDNSILVPSTEILEYSSKLLSNSCIKQYRSYLKMPSLILDSKEKENRRFPTKNSLIEDPVLFEHDRSMINPWTPEEKEVFMEMLATFGKDFTKISSFLDHKTTANCVEFYYKNHKSESFSEVKKRLLLKKKEAQLQSQQLAKSSAFLMAAGRKWSRESNAAAAIDILGAASVVVAYNQGAGLKGKQKVYSSKSRGNFCAVDRKESVAANLPYHMGHAVSSEAMSSCVTTSTDPIGKTSHVRTVIEEDACSEESCGGELVSADWTDDEKALFVQAYSTHGKDFSKISLRLGTRSRDQCKVFYCKAQKSLGLDFTNHREDNGDAGGTPPGNGDTNGGRSDTDDVAAEMDSGICSTQSCSKAAGDVTTTSEAVAQPENANGSSEQEVVGAVVNSEMFDCFPPKQGSITDGYTDLNEKPVPEGEKCGSEPMLNESETASMTCDDKASLPENKEKINLEVAVKQSNIECAEAVSDSALHRSGTSSTYLHEDVGERPIDTLKERTSSAHHVTLPHQAGTARSRRCASVDLGASSSVISFASDSGVSENVLAGSFGSSYFSQLSLEVHPVKNRSVQFGSGPAFSHPSSSICFSGNPHGLSQATFNFDEHLTKPHHSVPSTNNLLQQCLQKSNPVVNQTNQSSHLLKGYPLQMPNHTGVKSEADFLGHMKLSEFSRPSQLFGLNAPNASNCQATEILTSQKRDEKCEFSVQPASQPGGLAVNDAHCRTGDVKLFGKILTQSSSEKMCTRPPSPKLNPKESSSSMHNQPVASVTNGHSFGTPLFSRPAGVGAGNQFGLEGLPVQSHGFWDGNKIQTGFPTLPESARMMVKHHDSLGGVLPFHPGKDGNSSNILVNLSNYQQPHMQKLASNGGRVEGFSMTVPRRSVEMGNQFPPNMVGAGAGLIRAGGVVSDPVVALKMHYASNAKVCSSRGTSSGRESWSDVGR